MGSQPLFVRNSIPDGNWHFLRVIENSVELLQERIQSEVDLTEGLKSQTNSASIECYRQLIVRRTVEMVKAIALLWQHKQDVAALIVSRALLETIVSFHNFLACLETALAEKDYDKIEKIIDVYVLSSRDQEKLERLKLNKSEHIMNQIRGYAEKVEPKTKLFYDQISDVCHPNGYPMLIHYGTLKDNKFIAKESDRRENFQGVYNCIYQICWLYCSMEELDQMLDRIRYSS